MHRDVAPPFFVKNQAPQDGAIEIVFLVGSPLLVARLRKLRCPAIDNILTNLAIHGEEAVAWNLCWKLWSGCPITTSLNKMPACPAISLKLMYPAYTRFVKRNNDCLNMSFLVVYLDDIQVSEYYIYDTNLRNTSYVCSNDCCRCNVIHILYNYNVYSHIRYQHCWQSFTEPDGFCYRRL